MNTQITEDYCDFETAKLLKEKGFNAPTCGFYYDNYTEELIVTSPSNHNGSINAFSAPSLGHAMKWLREVHNLYIGIVLHQDVKDEISPIENYYHFNTSRLNRFANEGGDCKIYYSYEAACEAAIKYCLTDLI